MLRKIRFIYFPEHEMTINTVEVRASAERAENNRETPASGSGNSNSGSSGKVPGFSNLDKPGKSAVSSAQINRVQAIISANTAFGNKVTKDQKDEIGRLLNNEKIQAAATSRRADVNYIQSQIDRLEKRFENGIPLEVKLVGKLYNYFKRRKKNLRYWETVLTYDDLSTEMVYIRSANQQEYEALPEPIKRPSFTIMFDPPIDHEQVMQYIYGTTPFPEVK